MPPWILHEDDDLLAVAKPAGVNTHRPAPHAQEGIYEWVQARRPGQDLALLHRLDKATSGVLLLGKSDRANRAVNAQHEARSVDKRYLLLTPGAPRRPERLFCDERIASKRRGPPQPAETAFERLEAGAGFELWEARPRTGRTHQVRVHAARVGLAIAGDTERADAGAVPAARLFLHAAALTVQHPDGSGPLTAASPLPESFRLVLASAPPHGAAVAVRAAHEARAPLVDPAETTAFRWIDRHHDGLPDVEVERYGRVALVLRRDDRPDPLPDDLVRALHDAPGVAAVVARRRPRDARRAGEEPLRVLAGELPGTRFEVAELGLRYVVDLEASGTSTGLFLDQRETRRRLLARDLAGKTVLNAFAHTGSLSVAAARAGAETLTLDLSKGYLEWARENMRRNGIDPTAHDFIYGDALDWLRRLAKKGRRFDLVLLDPPSFSRAGKGKKTWSVADDLPALVERSARLTAPGGALFVSTNLRRLAPRRFLAMLEEGLQAAGRHGQPEPTTLPLDFRSGLQDPPYLKAAWLEPLE